MATEFRKLDFVKDPPPVSKWDEETGVGLQVFHLLCAWKESPTGRWHYAVMHWDGEEWIDAEEGWAWQPDLVQQWCLIKPPLG